MIEIGDKLSVIMAGTLVITLKLVVSIIAYKIVKLGYDLLLRGVKGEFQFSGQIAGNKADLKSASPGLLFVLLGCAVMAIAITTKFPQKIDYKDKPAITDISAPKPEQSHLDLKAFLNGDDHE